MEKIRSAYLLWRQNELFRLSTLGGLGEMARAIPFDPAMMRYLDIVGSSKEHPNEIFAHKAMELSLLGEGRYTEENARAGGWKTERLRRE